MYKNALKEDLIRVVEELDGTVESTDTVAKLKTKIEKSSTFESDADFVKTLIKSYIDERVSRNERQATLEKQKIELAKLQLAQSEKEVELQTTKNKALNSLVSMKKKKNQVPLRTAYGQADRSGIGGCGVVIQLNLSTKQSTQSSRAGAADPM
ncbi:hypothetical protein TNCT_691241 [Trichonephila clavata]|uniref:Uncharacterized protein n=1 Tax=Trichonephila clavata TaxID=2740835 RepID=A0A8X6F0L4_TRICU|nr:hypothetical protein TNCT_691241 [Trichonephila clavata]